MRYCTYCGKELLFPHSHIGMGGLVDNLCSNADCRIATISYAPIRMGADSDIITTRLDEPTWK